MVDRLEPQPRQYRPPPFPYDPNKALTYDEHGHGHAYVAMVQQGTVAAARQQRLGLASGWISVTFGALQLFAPRAFKRAAGMAYPDWLIRVVGARDLALGLGLLSQPKSPGLRWTRVVNDVVDTGLIGAAAFMPSTDRRRLAGFAALAAGVIALDVAAARRRMPSHETLPGTGGQRRVIKSISVNRPPEECYAMWRNVERFPAFMQHVEEVRVIDERRSHWRARGPAGRDVEWDAEITEDQPNRMLAWQSVGDADVHHSGMVRFSPAPGGKGTVIEVEMAYRPPAGTAGAMAAMLFGEEPSLQIEGDLRRFKQLAETGEIVSTRGQPHGERSLKARWFNREVEQ